MKKLTRAEQELYNTLYQARPETLTINDLSAVLDTVRSAGRESNGWNDGNLVAVHIRNLRGKLPTTQAIETVRGVGYRLIA